MQISETSNVFNIVEELVNKLNLKMVGFCWRKRWPAYSVPVLEHVVLLLN